MQKRKILFAIIFTVLGFLAFQFSIDKIIGADQNFTLFEFLGPIGGMFLGPILGGKLRDISGAWTLSFMALRHLPLSIAAPLRATRNSRISSTCLPASMAASSRLESRRQTKSETEVA